MYVESQPTQRRSNGARFAAPLCAAALAIGISGCAGEDTTAEGTKTASEQAVELVSLEAANSPGTSPWMDSTTSADLPRQLNRVETQSDPRTVSGGQFGLYGGSTNAAVCDRDKMVDFLGQNPAHAAAWRAVTGASDIRAYASTLSPVVLTRDTQVTNHGFENGEATAFQSVLQTGTAVMIDNRGVPRVRCDSGSPLAVPRDDVEVEFTGTGWQGLDTNSIVKVQETDAPIEKLELVALGDADAPPPPFQFVAMDVGAIEAIAAPEIVLPQGASLVAVTVTPLTVETPSASPDVTTTSPSETTTSATPTATETSATTTAPTTPDDTGTVDEPIVEEPIVEEPVVEEPIVEEPIVEDPQISLAPSP
jgi:hypothetical protein